MSLLLALTEVAQAQTPAAGHSWRWSPPQRPKIDFEAFTDRPKVVEREPVRTEVRTDVAGYVDPEAKAYSDFLVAKLIAAVNAQEAARKIAQSAIRAEAIRQAEIELMAAIEEERRIKQEIQDFDVAYVMAMLAEA